MGYTPLFYPGRFPPPRLFFRSNSNSLSFVPSIPPIPVVFEKFNKGATASSSPSRPAKHPFSTWSYHFLAFGVVLFLFPPLATKGRSTDHTVSPPEFTKVGLHLLGRSSLRPLFNMAKLKPGEKIGSEKIRPVYSRINRLRSYIGVDSSGFESDTGGQDR